MRIGRPFMLARPASRVGLRAEIRCLKTKYALCFSGQLPLPSDPSLPLRRRVGPRRDTVSSASYFPPFYTHPERSEGVWNRAAPRHMGYSPHTQSKPYLPIECCLLRAPRYIQRSAAGGCSCVAPCRRRGRGSENGNHPSHVFRFFPSPAGRVPHTFQS